MENLLQQFPKIDAVIATNDEMALGAIEAIDAAKRLKEIKVAGFDGNNDALKSISEGRLVITGAQRPDAQAYWSVMATYMFLEGYPVPRDIYVPMSGRRQEQCRGVPEKDQKITLSAPPLSKPAPAREGRTVRSVI